MVPRVWMQADECTEKPGGRRARAGSRGLRRTTKARTDPMRVAMENTVPIVSQQRADTVDLLHGAEAGRRALACFSRAARSFGQGACRGSEIYLLLAHGGGDRRISGLEAFEACQRFIALALDYRSKGEQVAPLRGRHESIRGTATTQNRRRLSTLRCSRDWSAACPGRRETR